jgi:hypothetical protein
MNWLRRQPRTDSDVDLDDELSELATERALTEMWLSDLDARVLAIEERLGVEPGRLDLQSRLDDLEELAEFLPAAYAARDRARVERQHQPLPGFPDWHS